MTGTNFPDSDRRSGLLEHYLASRAGTPSGSQDTGLNPVSEKLKGMLDGAIAKAGLDNSSSNNIDAGELRKGFEGGSIARVV